MFPIAATTVLVVEQFDLTGCCIANLKSSYYGAKYKRKKNWSVKWLNFHTFTESSMFLKAQTGTMAS